MLMDDEENESTYTIVYEKIASDKELLAVTRLLANTLMINSYMTVKQFLTGLSDHDLQLLMEAVDLVEEDEGEEFGHAELILIAEMLAKAEGLESGTVDTICERVNALSAFLAVESLGRKGFVRVIHENMSFGEDMREKPIVEKLPGVDYDALRGSDLE